MIKNIKEIIAVIICQYLKKKWTIVVDRTTDNLKITHKKIEGQIENRDIFNEELGILDKLSRSDVLSFEIMYSDGNIKLIN